MKKIVAIHDMSCFGRASLTVVIPIISSMGIQVCPIPTAILSAHTQYEGFESFDLTSFMPKVVEHWKKLDLSFEAVYSGFLASTKQMSIVVDIINNFKSKDGFVLIDPVLGDQGKLYKGFDKDMVCGMRNLCEHADIITPNITEAAFLLGHKLENNISVDTTVGWCKELSKYGPKYVIITSAPSNLKNMIATIVYDRINDRTSFVECKKIPASYPGTGDGFASVVVASMLNGDNIENAVSRAAYFIDAGINLTYNNSGKALDGIFQEEVIPLLRGAVPEKYNCREITV